MCGLSVYMRVVILIAATGCAANDVEETRRHKCTRYRDHLVNLRIADLPVGREDSVAVAHREAMTRALGDDFVTSCEQTVGNAALDCGLAARDVSGASRCVEQ